MKKQTKAQRLLQLQTKRLLIFGSGVVLVCVAIAYGLIQTKTPTQPQRMIIIYDRGVERSIITTASTTSGALQDAGIAVDPRDTIEPSIDTKLSDSRIYIIIYRSRPVAIADGAIKQTLMTPRQSANDILKEAGLKPLSPKDESSFSRGDTIIDGAQTKLTVQRAKIEKPRPVVFQSKQNALTASKGAHIYVDGDGVAHRETYYDLPMNVVIQSCGSTNTYSIRSDGAKVDQDGYVLVAANLNSYPRCTVVDTSLGLGKVYDTGGFALRHPYGFDLATDWTRYDGI